MSRAGLPRDPFPHAGHTGRHMSLLLDVALLHDALACGDLIAHELEELGRHFSRGAFMALYGRIRLIRAGALPARPCGSFHL